VEVTILTEYKVEKNNDSDNNKA